MNLFPREPKVQVKNQATAAKVKNPNDWISRLILDRT